MSVTELTREQLSELKQSYLCEHQDSISWGELSEADELVADEVVFEEYASTDFVEADFYCNAA